MAKRFRDTKKWRGWYRELPPVIKLLFDYMCDECCHAGIFKEDYVIASVCIGATVNREMVEQHLVKHVQRIDDDKLFIPSFIEFQYDVSREPGKRKLNPANNAHRGVILELQRNGIDPAPWLLDGPVSDSVSPASKSSPSLAPSEPLARGPGKGTRKGNGKGNGRGGVGEKPILSVVAPTGNAEEGDQPPVPDCGYCFKSGTVLARNKHDDRENRFLCVCGAPGDARDPPWSPLFLADFELLTFHGGSA